MNYNSKFHLVINYHLNGFINGFLALFNWVCYSIKFSGLIIYVYHEPVFY